MNTLITICARGGSKGIPNKNIKLIGGHPLIYYTLKVAHCFAEQSLGNVDIILSTDSKKIKDTVISTEFKDVNLEYERPSKLATDDSGKLDVIVDAKKFMENKKHILYDYVIDLDVTSPLRSITDINSAFNIIKNDSSANNIFSVNSANRNPYFNMVEQDESGYYRLCKEGNFLTRQSSPKVYDLNASFYIFKKKFFDLGKKTINDKTLIYKMDHICFDLDHPLDFEFMQYLMQNDKLDFELLK